MTVKEYRLKHPHCKFCKYCSVNTWTQDWYCSAKEKLIIINQARWCPIFNLKGGAE